MLLMRRESRIRSTHQEAFFVAIDSNLGGVVGEKEEAVASVLGNKGRIAQAWVNVAWRYENFAAHFWHTEG